jgi:hypothetical protein
MEPPEICLLDIFPRVKRTTKETTEETRSRGRTQRRHLASHVTAALSKAAHSGPYPCVCEREPLPTSHNWPRADRAFCVQPPCCRQSDSVHPCGQDRFIRPAPSTRSDYKAWRSLRFLAFVPRPACSAACAFQRTKQSTEARLLCGVCTFFVSHKTLRLLHSVQLWGLYTLQCAHQPLRRLHGVYERSALLALICLRQHVSQ